MSVAILDDETAEQYGENDPAHIHHLVDKMQKGFAATRTIHKLAVKTGALDVLYEDADVIVYRDNVGRGFTKAPELMGITDFADKEALRRVHRALASEYVETRTDEEYFVYEKQ